MSLSAPDPSSSPYPPTPTTNTPIGPWITIASFLVVVGVFQWGTVLHSKLAKRRRSRKDPDEESTSSSRPPSSGRWSLTRLPLVVVNAFRVIAFRWTVEIGSYELKVIEIFLTLAYLGCLWGWVFRGVTTYGVTALNVWIYCARAGLFAASQFPLVTALGTKHNIVSLITGIGYEKLNFFHRVAARSCLVLLFFHASGELYSAISQSYINLIIGQSFLHFGMTAVSTLTLIVVISIRPIRIKFYEVFFHMHLVLVLVFLIAAYFHTHYTGNSHWIWPSFVIWGLDRLLRLARVLSSNHLYWGRNHRAKLLDARTELLSDDFVRVRVRRPDHFQWSAGQTAYLIAPSVSAFPLEAHPFSIASVDSTLFHPNAINKRSTTNGGAIDFGEATDWKELVFLINVRGGFTKRLKEVAAQNQSVKLFIDGPYGRAPDMGAYDTSIFVAGGSGITYTLPVFLNLIEEAGKYSCRCRKVVFIWAVRDASHLQWIADALYQANALTPSWLNVSIRIFATRGGIPFSENSADPERTPYKEGEPDWTMLPSVSVEHGRPDLMAILRGEASTATGTMSVTVCGSQGLTKSVRRALRFPVSGPASILSGGPSVTLHVESFGYA